MVLQTKIKALLRKSFLKSFETHRHLQTIYILVLCTKEERSNISRLAGLGTKNHICMRRFCATIWWHSSLTFCTYRHNKNSLNSESQGCITDLILTGSRSWFNFLKQTGLECIQIQHLKTNWIWIHEFYKTWTRARHFYLKNFFLFCDEK